MSEQVTRSLALLAERGSDRTADEVLDAARAQAAGSLPPLRRGTRLAVAVAILAVVSVVALAVADATRHDVGPIIDDPVESVPVVPDDVEPPAGALGPVDPATYFELVEDVEFATSGPDLWAWQLRLDTGSARLARYTSGVWWGYPAPPADLPADRETFDWGPGVEGPGWVWTWDVAQLPDGTIVAATGRGLHELTEDGWQPHPGWQDIPGCDGWGCSEQSRHPTAVEVDPTSGTAWVAAGSGLYRWEGDEITNAAPGPEIWTYDARWIGDLAVTPDGMVWGTGYAAPYWLQMYVPGGDSWEVVDPWPGPQDSNVAVMALAPNGDLWAVKNLTGDGRTGRSWSLARRDAGTRVWSSYDAWLPDADGSLWDIPSTMVADDRGVWVAFRQYDPATQTVEAGSGVHHFNGTNWETWHQTHRIEAVGRAGDGTTWAAIRDHGLVALETDWGP